MKRIRVLALIATVSLAGTLSGRSRPKAASAVAARPLAQSETASPPNSSPGSIYSSGGRLANLERDLRGSQVHDLITIVVADQASAVTTGTTNTSRKSSAANSIAALAGVTRAAGPWANLANLSNNQQLQGAGTTSRQNTLNTTLSAEIVSVTGNGNLIIEGRKVITVNGEKQTVIVRGVVRPDDVSPVNSVSSAQIAGLEVSVNGKGVVGDSTRRPFILYRLLLGLLPF